MSAQCKMLNLGDLSLIEEPLLFKELCKWDEVKWSKDDWRRCLGESETYPFRKGRFLCSKVPQWERSCKTEHMTTGKFFDSYFDNTENSGEWLYFDYKHISQWLKTSSELTFNWECLGYPDKNAGDSTIWIGTKGAHTCCHVDTYGCNFVAQLFGKKTWLLFPPKEIDTMRPTRVPYEESSIYSSCNFACGCAAFPEVRDVRMVTLEPGDILFVPHHWWHYVENETSAISVNIWIPQPCDDRERLKESLVKSTVVSFVKGLCEDDAHQLLNPNEEDLVSFSNSAAEVAWCIRQISSSSEIKDRPSMDSSRASDLAQRALPRTSVDEVTRYLKGKCRGIRVTESGGNTVEISNVGRLINAFCHPDVINLVYRKLLGND